MLILLHIQIATKEKAKEQIIINRDLIEMIFCGRNLQTMELCKQKLKMNSKGAILVSFFKPQIMPMGKHSMLFHQNDCK